MSLLHTPIKILENSGNKLENYVIKILLDSSWDGWSNTTQSGDDIHFMDGGRSPLFFWIEKWDYLNQKAIIWVRVPEIPANDVIKIYLRHGLKNPYRFFSNPRKVFDFFDDFEVWEGWKTYGSGRVIQASDYVYYGSHSLKKIDHCDPSGGYKQMGIILTVTQNIGIALECWDYRDESWGTSCPVDRFGLEDDNFNGYTTFIDRHNDRFGIDVRTNGSPTESYTTITLPNQAYFVRLALFSGKQILCIYSDPEMTSQIASYILNDTKYTTFTRVIVHGGNPYYLDCLRVRKYVEPEPTVELEASCSPCIL